MHIIPKYESIAKRVPQETHIFLRNALKQLHTKFIQVDTRIQRHVQFHVWDPLIPYNNYMPVFMHGIV